MKKLTFLFFISSLVNYGQDSTKTSIFENKVKHPIKEFYVATGGELIFSFADVRVDSMSVENKLRFSLFPHIQQQYHFNFGKAIGFYTGISLINVGFKNEYVLSDNTTRFELRQRSLSFGVPLALKLGDMENGNYIAIGASAEIMTQYKYKFYFKDTKVKNTHWFPDQVNLFNPSVFIDLRNKTGGYIRFKYYLDNFLTPMISNFSVPGDSEIISILPTQSTLFYISIGSTFMKKKKPQKLTKDDV